MTEMRKELPPLPPKMRRLHIDERGYPVPWFCAWMLEGIEVDPLTPGSKPDFRVIGSTKVRDACGGRCWVCGRPARCS